MKTATAPDTTLTIGHHAINPTSTPIMASMNKNPAPTLPSASWLYDISALYHLFGSIKQPPVYSFRPQQPCYH